MPSMDILKCKDDSYYVGSSTDREKRLEEHLQGKCKYTKSRLPVKLVYYELYSTLSDARKREMQVKRWKSRRMIEKLIDK